MAKKSERRTECIDSNIGLWSIALIKPNGWSTRTTAIRLTDDSLALISPTRGLQDQVEALGTPSFLVAPNHFHHMGIASYLEKWPDAKAITSAGALPRLEKKSDIPSFGNLDALREVLPSGVTILEAPCLKNGEIMLRAETETGIIWSVSDAFFALAEHPTGFMGLVTRATGTSKGLRIGKTFTTLAITDRKVYGAWLREQLETDKPTILIPGHGEIISGPDLYGQIDGLLRSRLQS